MLLPCSALAFADLEKAYAEALGVPEAVLLPSVRAGIHMALRVLATPDTLVVGPAYTCCVVHQAMRMSGASLTFCDASPNRFLMGSADIVAASKPDSCVLLSELYGIPYDDALLRDTAEDRTRARILDMAMSVPEPARLKRLRETDVAFFSFNMNKSMYAGGGGIACLTSGTLAEKIREMRNACVVEESAMNRLRNDLGVIARVFIRTRTLCRLGAVAAAKWRHRAARSRRHASTAAPLDETSAALSAEWTRPMTLFSRKLALHNLRRAKVSADIRRRQAETYVACLGGHDLLRGVDVESLPQSHFPILVDGTLRERLLKYLRSHGTDAGIEFPFPKGLDRTVFPNAAKAGEEVLTLPMGDRVSLGEVKTVSKCVLNALHEFHKRPA